MNDALTTQVRAWIARDPDPVTRAELSALLNGHDHDELRARFANRLQFGTAGLRGVLGAGPARMNRLVVRESSAGFGAYVIEHVPDARRRGIVVGYDARHGSRAFAEDAAGVFTALGLPVYLFVAPGPTPLCAFALRQLGGAGAVMVTASHNPREYNGYKVYWHNGAQIIAPHDTGIAAAIDRAARSSPPTCLPLDKARRRGLLRDIDASMRNTYLETALRRCVRDSGGVPRARLRIAYTPLHGVGADLTESALRATGICDVVTVASQRQPDADFPTVAFPNPEEPGAMDAVLALARASGADLAAAHDPDADRLCIAVRDNSCGDFDLLTGDELGVVLGADLIRRAAGRGFVATTIVSARLLQAVAQDAGAGCLTTLTGFKWLASRAIEHEQTSGEPFLFAYEEALGYCIGGLGWDKDGISALLCVVRLASELKAQGETLRTLLETIWARHGVCLTRQCSIRVDAGAAGAPLADRLRGEPPAQIAGRAVVATTDLQDGMRLSHAGERTHTGLPPSDVLIYELDDGARVIVRPSGTEPKVKCYYEVWATTDAQVSCRDAHRQARETLAALVAAHQRELQLRALTPDHE